MANIYTDIAMFDAEYYLANNPDLVAAGYTVANAGEHYVEYGANEGRMPNTWFDADFYQAQNPDLAAAGLSKSDLLKHFAQYGAFEGRNPNPAFGEGQSIAANLYLEYALANKDLLEAFGIAADATRLTDEQAAQIVQHFFVYGVNEEREGGIADIIIDEQKALEAALDVYTAAVKGQKDALKLQADNATAAQKSLEEIQEKEGEKESEDQNSPLVSASNIDGAVVAAVNGMVGASDSALATDVEYTDEVIAGARVQLQAKVDAAQKTLNELGDKSKAAIELNTALKGYEAAAKKAAENVEAAKEAAAVAGVKNGKTDAITEITFEGANSAEDFVAKVTLAGQEYAISIAKGKVTIGEENVDKAAFDKLEGSADLLAAIQAVYGNISALEKAAKPVQAAVTKVLKAEGYTVVDAAGKAADWNKVKFDEDGQVSAKEGFTLKVPADADADADVYGYKVAKIANGGTVLTEGLTEVVAPVSDSVKSALDAKDLADQNLEKFNDAVDTWKELKAIQDGLKADADAVKAADDAVKAAADVFEDLGYNLVDADNESTAYDEDDAEQLADLFVFAGSAPVVTDFDGNDMFYFGEAAAGKAFTFKAVEKVGDIKAESDVNAFEIFAVEANGDTTLYVESKAFAGNSANPVDKNSDLVEITLSGVSVDDLQFEDGFLSFVA